MDIRASIPFFAGKVRASLSIPSFDENFDKEMGVLKNESLKAKLSDAVSQLRAA